jgi:hypothetical protein
MLCRICRGAAYGRTALAQCRLKNLIDAHRCAFVQWKVGERDNKSVSEEQRRIGSELQEIGEKFDAEWSTARIVFAPYLSFGHIRK